MPSLSVVVAPTKGVAMSSRLKPRRGDAPEEEEARGGGRGRRRERRRKAPPLDAEGVVVTTE
jgi:hypothetical protein